MYLPPGFAELTPYVFVENADDYLEFLKTAFGSAERGISRRPDGTIANAQMGFGSATMMVSETQEGLGSSQAAFYLFVDDAEEAMRRAMKAGAQCIMDVDDMPYGDRQGGVRDRAGNIWWLSQRLSEEPYFSE